ncbi:MAG: FHA domain-containing protein [Polyangiales bacterium]
MLKLVISDNEGTTTVVPLARDEISIGRKEGNTIRLTERNISRAHCKLQRQNGGFLVRDLRSYNGVLVNGQRVVGELQVKAGDEMRIGDYTLLLETEKAEADDADELESSPTVLAPIPRAAPPPRLVVLTAPLAGAEFSLPEKGEVRVGRGSELDVTIDHRSVSREHAKIACEDGQARIVDLGSINGVVVNHEKVVETTLKPGDVIELGDVVLRFVGPGERFVFDPEEARRLLPQRARNAPKLLAGAVVLLGAVIAIWIVRSLGTPAPSTASSKPATPPQAVAAPVPVAAPSPVAEQDHYQELLEACRSANDGGRYAEAVAHANAALKAHPEADDALDCRNIARINNEQEQIVVRAKAAVQAGDDEGAWKELSSLSGESTVAARPDVLALLASAARARVSEAQSMQRKRPDQAAAVAGSVLVVPLVPAPVRAQAQAIVSKVSAAHPAKPSRAEVAQVAAPPQEAPHPAKPAPAPHASERSPMDAASACLARGDNACVIRALNGKAQSAQELGLLIETYRAVGDSAQAFHNMATYVQRFPTARRAEAYRQMLERQGH